MTLTIQVEVTGQQRSGTSQKGNLYIMCEGYAKLPNIPYPQQFQFYCANQQEVPRNGFYEVDVVCSVKNGKIEFDVDPRQGRLIQAPSNSKAS